MIYKYLLEIKYRVFFSFVAWGFIIINCYYFKETLLYVFIKLSVTPKNNNLFYFLTTDVAEVFFVYLNLAFYAATQLTIVFLYCQFFHFLSTGLHTFEYIYLKTILQVILICWVIFIFMLHNFIFPASWDFFLTFQEYFSFQNLSFYFEAKLNEYLVFYKSLYYLCNLIFQIVIFFLIIIDLFKTNLLVVKHLRKFFYLLFLIVSTLITPPEVIYQLLIGIWITVIYEVITIYMVLKAELVTS